MRNDPILAAKAALVTLRAGGTQVLLTWLSNGFDENAPYASAIAAGVPILLTEIAVVFFGLRENRIMDSKRIGTGAETIVGMSVAFQSLFVGVFFLVISALSVNEYYWAVVLVILIAVPIVVAFTLLQKDRLEKAARTQMFRRMVRC